jgi:L-2-hydroxyglutarate oxidase LhgO
MEQIDAVIVGAGAVGLAIAANIARENRETYVLEKETTYGQGTSSRNSEVIHAGIYYLKGSLKAKLCVKANPMIYEICEKQDIPYSRVGKLIIANGEEEIKQLEGIIANARECGARDLELIDSERVHELEPNVRADAAILSPSTGNMDAHGLMDHYHREARRKSGGDPLILTATSSIWSPRETDSPWARGWSSTPQASIQTESQRWRASTSTRRATGSIGARETTSASPVSPRRRC